MSVASISMGVSRLATATTTEAFDGSMRHACSGDDSISIVPTGIGFLAARPFEHALPGSRATPSG